MAECIKWSSHETANDNGPADPVMKVRLDALVYVLARALGRQIAREEFERRLGEIANDNRPSESEDGRQG